jgi:polyhydroxybutyrate depolymerase
MLKEPIDERRFSAQGASMAAKFRGIACLALCLASGMALMACGGGSGALDNSGSSGGGSGSSGGSSGSGSLTCQQQFSPDKAAAGDNCTPTYGQFCPNTGSGSPVTNDQNVNACDGVNVSTGTVSAGSLSSDYFVAEPANVASDAPIYIALHWANANGQTMVNRMRLTELAKGRALTVVAPTAPGQVPFRTWGNSVVASTSPVADRIALIDALITQLQNASTVKAAASRPIVLAGVSGGAVLAYEYACAHAERLAGVLLVAAEVTPADASACQFDAPLASVQVMGTNDLIAPYNATPGLSAGAQPVFASFYTNNGCDASKIKSATLPPASSDVGISGIQVQWVTECTTDRGSALVTVDGGGHGWPGAQGPLNLPVTIYGPISKGFDATLQGYDLLRYLGG